MLLTELIVFDKYLKQLPYIIGNYTIIAWEVWNFNSVLLLI